ncbi:hypothetical protein FOY91_16035 [Sphingomonas solaris]|uniref:Uncharacterized protein n=1 Tax=Alterirhizorhabdus solaris TaxID=2529389 RepID=A0A558QXH4_9SPHN|nr:hypothetical protein FOY91_16035 [Sphingomonas solaris]
MILKASQRGGGMQLAVHLLKSENEHVEVHEVRGFVSDDLKGSSRRAGGRFDGGIVRSAGRPTHDSRGI